VISKVKVKGFLINPFIRQNNRTKWVANTNVFSTRRVGKKI